MQLASGIYFYRISDNSIDWKNNFVATKKLIVIKQKVINLVTIWSSTFRILRKLQEIKDSNDSRPLRSQKCPAY
jgi:hypothetical protein